MSIQYNVAAALIESDVSEQNFTLLNDATLHRLISVMTLSVDDAMTQAYPGQQGGEVEVRETDGAIHRVRLADVVNASEADVRARFRAATEAAVGLARAQEIEACIDGLERSDNAGQLASLLRAPAA